MPAIFNDFKQFLLSLIELKEKEGEDSCLNQLEQKLLGLTEYRDSLSSIEDDWLNMEEFRRINSPIINQSEFAEYVCAKERGYAGDFKTQEMIWMGITEGGEYRYSGKTKLGKLINSLTYGLANPRANVDRILRLKKLIKKNIEAGKTRFASIGAGPCIEWWNYSGKGLNGIDLFLLDQDQGALDRAKEKLQPKNNNVTFFNESVKRFLLKNKADGLGERDLIYLVGLLDYFDFDLSMLTIKNLWEFVAPGGALLITNAHPDNPTRFWTEYAGDWFLDHKTKDIMEKFPKPLKGVKKSEYEVDDFGCYQFIQIFKE